MVANMLRWFLRRLDIAVDGAIHGVAFCIVLYAAWIIWQPALRPLFQPVLDLVCR